MWYCIDPNHKSQSVLSKLWGYFFKIWGVIYIMTVLGKCYFYKTVTLLTVLQYFTL